MLNRMLNLTPPCIPSHLYYNVEVRSKIFWPWRVLFTDAAQAEMSIEVISWCILLDHFVPSMHPWEDKLAHVLHLREGPIHGSYYMEVRRRIIRGLVRGTRWIAGSNVVRMVQPPFGQSGPSIMLFTLTSLLL